MWSVSCFPRRTAVSVHRCATWSASAPRSTFSPPVTGAVAWASSSRSSVRAFNRATSARAFRASAARVDRSVGRSRDGLETELQSGERGLELMRGVRRELLLGVHVGFQRVGHRVERLTELRELTDRVGLRSRVELARSEPASDLAQASHRAGQASGEKCCDARCRRSTPGARDPPTRDHGSSCGIARPTSVGPPERPPRCGRPPTRER